MAKTRKKKPVFEYVEPIGSRVVVRKDEPKRETKGGIALPDQAEIPTITGRIVTISTLIENDEDVPLRQYDKILFHPKNAIPVDFEPDNQLFVVPVEDIVAVFRREDAPPDQLFGANLRLIVEDVLDMPLPTIRPATKDDSKQLACLLTWLGHDTSPERIVSMWNDWTATGNVALVASHPNDELAGVATLHHMHVLHRPKPVGRITALFVREDSRGRGIGRALVDAAEKRLLKSGCGFLEITSNFKLPDAHAFYEHLGYTRTSIRLAKDLRQSDR